MCNRSTGLACAFWQSVICNDKESHCHTWWLCCLVVLIQKKNLFKSVAQDLELVYNVGCELEKKNSHLRESFKKIWRNLFAQSYHKWYTQFTLRSNILSKACVSSSTLKCLFLSTVRIQAISVDSASFWSDGVIIRCTNQPLISVVPCFLQNFVNQVININNIKAHVHGFKSAINEWIVGVKSLFLTVVHFVNSNAIFRGSHVSLISWFSCRSFGGNEFGDVGFCGGRKNGEPGVKP